MISFHAVVNPRWKQAHGLLRYWYRDSAFMAGSAGLAQSIELHWYEHFLTIASSTYVVGVSKHSVVLLHVVQEVA